MQAADVMTAEVVTVAEGATVSDAAGLMLKRRVSALPVVDSLGKLIGIVSEGDLIRRARSAAGLVVVSRSRSDGRVCVK